MSNLLETVATLGLGLVLVNKLADSLGSAVHDAKTQAGSILPQVPDSSGLLGHLLDDIGLGNGPANPAPPSTAPYNGLLGNTPATLTDSQLNAQIDQWFAASVGLFFGIGSYDPTNYRAFVAWATAQWVAGSASTFIPGMNGVIPPVYPASAPAYFNALSKSYWGQNPYSSPTSGQFS